MILIDELQESLFGHFTAMDEEIQLKFEMRICFVLLQIKFE
jgi:hypothetical protein